MSGRREFTPQEAASIRALLAELRGADPSRQKTLRRRLRSLGFRLSEHADGERVTAERFDDMVARGDIRVAGDARVRADAPRLDHVDGAPDAVPSDAPSSSAVDMVAKLVGVDPVPAGEASPPYEFGVYAWWTTPAALPGVPLSPHPSLDGLGLAYVGIAHPATLHERIVGNHLGGSTGTSTLRKSVAAVVWRERRWQRRWTEGTERTPGRVVLLDESNDDLTRLLSTRFLVSWAQHRTPRAVERQVIGSLSPPLNNQHNRAHPFLPTLVVLRAELARQP